MTTPGEKLIVLDGRVTDEKLAELLDLQTEHPMLDFILSACRTPRCAVMPLPPRVVDTTLHPFVELM